MTVLQQAKFLVNQAEAALRGAEALLANDDRYTGHTGNALNAIDHISRAAEWAENGSEMIERLQDEGR